MTKTLRKFLAELEKTSSLFWNISPQTAEFLSALICDRKFKRALEIGTSNGYSGIWLAKALESTKGKLVTVESNKDRYSLAEKNFKKSGLKNIEQVFGHAPEIFPKIRGTFDFIFFDATKYEYSSYFKSLSSRLKKGGLIVADNINSHKKELNSYVKMVNKDKNFFSVKLNIGSGILLSFKVR